MEGLVRLTVYLRVLTVFSNFSCLVDLISLSVWLACIGPQQH